MQAKDVMVVNIQTLTGKRFAVKTSRKLPIVYVKRQVEVVEGIPRDQHRLIYAGQQLDESKLLSHYGFNSNDSMHLVLRLTGD